MLIMSREPHLREVIKPHVMHTLTAVRDGDGYETLPIRDRIDIVLSLIEASRFSGMDWKRLAVSQAKAAMCKLQHQYAESCIAQRESLLRRLAGHVKPTTPVADFGQGLGEGAANKRMHAANGSTVLQRALDLFQDEELLSAMDALKEWQPIEPASLAEEVVLFRINLLRGKILRFQGKFHDSLECLSKSRCATEVFRGLLHFDEEAGGLVVEMADTMRELDDAARAEELLTAQLERQCHTPATRALLALSLAESLFAQQKFPEADGLCRDAAGSERLSKMARLRLCITSAKLRHVSSDWEGAFAWWTKALIAINKFPPTSGHATRVIYLSLCHVLEHQGRKELEQASRAEVVKLEALSEHAEATHWIAGLRHWGHAGGSMFNAHYLIQTQCTRPHPNIVRCILCVPEGFFMERVGTTLQARIDHQSAPPSIRTQKRWITQIASALSWLEGLGRVHGDLRPSNILLTTDDDVRLADFDASVQIGQQLLVANLSSFPQAGPISEQFALASCIYTIRFGHIPLSELSAPDRVQSLMNHSFPPTESDTEFGHITLSCWKGQYDSINAVYGEIKTHDEAESVSADSSHTMPSLLAECEEFLAGEKKKEVDQSVFESRQL
ncbi:hypothetical protein L249_0942 [Ophiocordyceps polyrhachis-furcata BCC 54312]|uniref:Protein kinase domain-containing protein n=1 Tax=Ophiocordyceps polyrhachis-furcata BCC 54312 TaxID=1330021 RepID=A0A367LCG0_9HYPO|nr:hypothetical protein L249_0942 [Ophiocordyceps polyrhachis-furcata BCC 54312]